MTNEASTTKTNNDDQFMVSFDASTSLEFNDTINKRCTNYCYSKKKTFKHSSQAFLSASEADQRNVLYNMFQTSEIPYSVENMSYGPKANCSKVEKFDQILDRLLINVRVSVQEKVDVYINITKSHDLEINEGIFPEAKRTLDDWFERNEKRNWNTLSFSQRVAMTNKREIKWDVARELRRKETTRDEEDEEDRCPICLDELEKEQSMVLIPTSCSHVFHGSCIFQWFLVNATCPLCRLELLERDTIRTK